MTSFDVAPRWLHGWFFEVSEEKNGRKTRADVKEGINK
jgi:hypothetical protein